MTFSRFLWGLLGMTLGVIGSFVFGAFAWFCIVLVSFFVFFLFLRFMGVPPDETFHE